MNIQEEAGSSVIGTRDTVGQLDLLEVYRENQRKRQPKRTLLGLKQSTEIGFQGNPYKGA